MQITAVTTMKNEGPFILEWLAYMRSIGVDQFLVFTNDCEDGTEDILDAVSELGWLTHIRQDLADGESPQWAAYKSAWRRAQVKSADWVLVCDIDEFPQIDVGTGTLRDLIDHVGDCDAIPLEWRLFGNSNIVSFHNRPVTQQFVRTAPMGTDFPVASTFFKTLFKRSAFAGLGVHRPKQKNAAKHGSPVWKSSTGTILPDAFVDNSNRLSLLGMRDAEPAAHMRHYSLKSVEAFLVKRLRGLPNRSSKPIDLTYWVNRNFNTVEVAPLAIPQMDWPEPVARLHLAAVDWYRDRIKETVSTREGYNLFTDLLIAGGTHALSPAQSRMLYNLYQKTIGEDLTE